MARVKQHIAISRSDYAEKILYLEGKPFSVAAVPYMVPIINCDAEKSILMTGRQVGKSTTLSATILVEQTAIPHYRTLYVAPRNDQVTQFSGDRLSQMIAHSPYIQGNFINNKMIQQSHAKQFTNGSMTFLRSCFLSADGIRGLSANSIFIDEIQDILIDNLPVINECSSRKTPKRTMYTGTPKSFDNTIQKLWEQSSMHYWAIKCPHCCHWNVPIKEENLGIEWLQCAKCKKQIDAIAGEYVAMYPDRSFVGFHISQAMVAGVKALGIPWSRLREKVDDPLYGTSKLYNECLGFSYDVGSKLVSETELFACCDEETVCFSLQRKAEWQVYTVCAGIDYGVINGNTKTVLTIGGLDNEGNLRIFFSKKFAVDQDPISQLDEIVGYIRAAGVSVICADRGGGSLANSVLRRKLPRIAVHEIEYKAKVLSGMQYNKDAMSWMTDRTRAMGGVVLDIKSRKFVFPCRESMSSFFPDILTLTCDYNEKLRNFQITRGLNCPDDFAHSLVYLRIAAKFISKNQRATVHDLEQFQPPAGAAPEDQFPTY